MVSSYSLHVILEASAHHVDNGIDRQPYLFLVELCERYLVVKNPLELA